MFSGAGKQARSTVSSANLGTCGVAFRLQHAGDIPGRFTPSLRTSGVVAYLRVSRNPVGVEELREFELRVWDTKNDDRHMSARVCEKR